MEIAENAALVVVDVQEGFEEEAYWGPRNNPSADENIAGLIDAWQESGRPVVFVRHDSPKPDSPLRVGYPGNAFKSYVEERRGKGDGPELFLTKSVNSAFYGTPDLAEWLRGGGVRQIVVAGIQTNMCAETTARMAGNLGYEVFFAFDATYTFDGTGPFGWTMRAEELARATAVTLHGGGFAKVVRSAELIAAAAG
ncbi:cysteine hydrolase family protein [Streptomyces sp. ITFR-6]|uniref:cysteine hydrolase family protein n=1 Tax=Streptomyces sp. ITFR-6 TaxID=3075197 RepID=UPI00288ADFA5|nr:cysteine hydrolase family protein [Streptomyces sp. ITFR-6]WNI31086.1 cysteine hydrolase family protein [Streptomyces sp. ITFR-6]